MGQLLHAVEEVREEVRALAEGEHREVGRGDEVADGHQRRVHLGDGDVHHAIDIRRDGDQVHVILCHGLLARVVVNVFDVFPARVERKRAPCFGGWRKGPAY